jgi:hypothetical protein
MANKKSTKLGIQVPKASASVRALKKNVRESLSTQVAMTKLVDQIKSDLDSMSEMGEMESLRLQMAMDRMSKLVSTLSNLLQKISDTAEQITHNLK